MPRRARRGGGGRQRRGGEASAKRASNLNVRARSVLDRWIDGSSGTGGQPVGIRSRMAGLNAPVDSMDHEPVLVLLLLQGQRWTNCSEQTM